ncbi:ESX-1 secretion-associated protein [Mycobacterium sp. 852013-51886_SCH5428379]|uniref:ESX-1 secretion-associated protein n=1 Tax=Mycobacterium sp. 852013-51886_SCH5428379 TaxID=1834111 RepID=UPI000A3FBF26|nr:ESX-1 secretion-associated protein [Mycobacterium sp. 852013-51886_SCH5428379]
MTADQLEGHAGEFRAAHQEAHTRASNAVLGSGSAAAALPGMLADWEAHGAKFGEAFAKHAQGHRDAADAYVRTDAGSADRIDDAGPTP